jgi:hypothetical protein
MRAASPHAVHTHTLSRITIRMATPFQHHTYDVEDPPTLEELEERISRGEEVIENYHTFLEMGGIPTIQMRQRVRSAMNELRGHRNRTNDTAPMSPRDRAVVADESWMNRDTVKFVVGAVASTAVTLTPVALAYLETRRAEARARQAQKEDEASQAREAAARAEERRDQLWLWGLMTAGKLAVEYMGSEKS